MPHPDELLRTSFKQQLPSWTCAKKKEREDEEIRGKRREARNILKSFLGLRESIMYLLPQISIALQGTFTPSKEFRKRCYSNFGTFPAPRGGVSSSSVERRRQNSRKLVTKLRSELFLRCFRNKVYRPLERTLKVGCLVATLLCLRVTPKNPISAFLINLNQPNEVSTLLYRCIFMILCIALRAFRRAKFAFCVQ